MWLVYEKLKVYVLYPPGGEAFRKQRIEAENEYGKIVLNLQFLTY
jgi:hypothetical protein